MTSAKVATREREALTRGQQARSLRLVSAPDEYDEFERGLIHRDIARTMSRYGHRYAPLPPSHPTTGESFADVWAWRLLLAIMSCGAIDGIFQLLFFAGFAVTITRVAPVSPVATGAATIVFDEVNGKIVVPVEINGERARLWLDTGSNVTLLTAEMGKRAHLVAEGAAVEGMGIGGGKVKEKRARADLLRLGGSAIKNASVWVEENPDPMFEGTNVGGLLGLDFLQKFQVRIAGGVIELTPLAAKRD